MTSKQANLISNIFRNRWYFISNTGMRILLEKRDDLEEKGTEIYCLLQ